MNGETCMNDILRNNVYPDGDPGMQVSRWGNSLAVRLPASVVAALDLKEGEEVEIHVAGTRSLEINRKPGRGALLARLRKYRGRLPADFHFDRFEARARARNKGR